MTEDEARILNALGWKKGTALESKSPADEILGKIKAMKRSVAYYQRDAAEAAAAVCPLSRGDPHSSCVLVEGAVQATEAEAHALRAAVRWALGESGDFPTRGGKAMALFGGAQSFAAAPFQFSPTPQF